jgi:hypothetical protein
MGDRSVPRTSDSGFSSPKSSAQMPVPVPTPSHVNKADWTRGAAVYVPMSKTRCGIEAKGDAYSLPSSSIRKMWCSRSRRSCSSSSLGRR